MAAIQSTSWASLSSWKHSILLKIGALLLLLSLAGSTYFVTASNLTGQLTGVSKAIEQAGTERMRIYKLASLLERFTPSEQNRAAIRAEMSHFERVVEGLRYGTPQHGPVAANDPPLASQLQALQDRWATRLKPALERALEGDVASSAVQDYLRLADDFVAGWDELVQLMERETAARLQTLRRRQIWSLVAFLALIAGATVFLNRFVRESLRQLTVGADR